MHKHRRHKCEAFLACHIWVPPYAEQHAGAVAQYDMKQAESKVKICVQSTSALITTKIHASHVNHRHIPSPS